MVLSDFKFFHMEDFQKSIGKNEVIHTFPEQTQPAEIV